MKRINVLFSTLLAAIALAGCSVVSSSGGDPIVVQPSVAPGVNAPTALFSDPGLTSYLASGIAIGGERAMIANMGGDAAISVAGATNSATFNAYPQYWDGAIGWAMQPAGATGYYDLSNVKTIKFKISSPNILPNQLAFFIQWKSSTSGNGNEYTLPLNVLGTTNMTDWVEVSIDLAQRIPDTSDQGVRYGYTAEKFFSGNGNKFVDTAFAIKWYGSAGTQANSGPLTSGTNYLIGDIQFLDSADQNVAIYTSVSAPIPANPPTTAANTPALDSSNVVNLYTSSSAYVNPVFDNWAESWGLSKISDADVAGHTVKKFTLSNSAPNTGSTLHATIDATGKKTLHISYFTRDGSKLGVKIVDFGGSSYTSPTETLVSASSITQNGWEDLEIDFTAQTLVNNIGQLIFTSDGVATSQTYWVDNIYFH